MKAHAITTQKEVRRWFWSMVKMCAPELLQHYRAAKRQNDYPAEVRVLFVDYVDSLQKSGDISRALAERVTL